MAVTPSEYLKEALDYIRLNSINRGKLNWVETWEAGLAEIELAQTPAEVYPFIRSTLARLEDSHSFFLEPEAVRRILQAVPTPTLQPEGRLLTQKIWYLNLPAVMGNTVVLEAYARAAQDILQVAAQGGAKGWIIDLRQNTGGNVVPMLAGLGPLLGTDHPGSFVYPDGTRLPWVYRNGKVWIGDWLGLKLDEFFQIQELLPPVAVLTGPQTASSGEIVLLAFRERPQMRSFGEATRGIPTCNDQKELSDGAIINLTVAFSADRTGQIYTTSISPDQVIKNEGVGLALMDDPVVKAALKWLNQQFARET